MEQCLAERLDRPVEGADSYSAVVYDNFVLAWSQVGSSVLQPERLTSRGQKGGGVDGHGGVLGGAIYSKTTSGISINVV